LRAKSFPTFEIQEEGTMLLRKLHNPAPYPREGAPDTKRMGGWVGPKDILGITRDKFLTPAKN